MSNDTMPAPPDEGETITRAEALKRDMLGGAFMCALSELDNSGEFISGLQDPIHIELAINGRTVNMRQFFERLERHFHERVARVAAESVPEQVAQKAADIRDLLSRVESELIAEAQRAFPEVDFDY